MSVTMLDCIKRVSPLTKEIVKNADINTDNLIKYLGEDIEKINEIIICAAGSSNTAALTSFQFMEKVTGVQVHPYTANQFDKKAVYNPRALYLFVSQTGTSTLVKEMVMKMNNLGYRTCTITEAETTPVAKAGKVHVDMGCGYEEYWYRTIGYCTSVATLMVIGLRIGLERGHISTSEYQGYLAEAVAAAENHPVVVEKAVKWFEDHKEKLVSARSFLIYGAGPLYGVALEGALKCLETAKHTLAIGYEAEDGLHGPTLGFIPGDVVIALNDGVNDDWMSQGVVNFSKKELGQGYIFGANPIDEDDLAFEVKGESFRALEFAPAVEILAFLLAEAVGTEVLDAKHATPHVSEKYFETHRG